MVFGDAKLGGHVVLEVAVMVMVETGAIGIVGAELFALPQALPLHCSDLISLVCGGLVLAVADGGVIWKPCEVQSERECTSHLQTTPLVTAVFDPGLPTK